MSQFIEMFGNPVANNKGWSTMALKQVAPEEPSRERQTGTVWILNLDMIESHTGKIIDKVYDEDTNLLSVASFDEGNVLYSKLRPYLNKVVIPKGKGYATTELVPLRPNQEYLNLTFFSHLLRGDDFVTYANTISSGTKMPRMPLNDLRNFQCILPPMEEQLKFEKVAEQADKSEFVGFKSQFIEMFEGEKYPRLSLDEICKEWSKGQGFKKDDICEDGETQCIHYGELFTKYGPVINEVISRTSVEKKKTSKKGDILFPASDVTPNGLARCSMLPFDNVILGGDIIILRPKDKYNPAYLSYAINQQTSQLLTRVNGGVVKHMSAKGLKTVEIPIPPMDKQGEYIQIAEQADKSEYYN